MPRQWPPPSRPRISADTSSGASSSMGWRLVFRFGRMTAGLVDRCFVSRVLVVEQNAVGRAVEVVVLTAVDRPEEDVDGDGHDQQRGRDHHIKSWHLDSMPARLRPAAGG